MHVISHDLHVYLYTWHIWVQQSTTTDIIYNSDCSTIILSLDFVLLLFIFFFTYKRTHVVFASVFICLVMFFRAHCFLFSCPYRRTNTAIKKYNSFLDGEAKAHYRRNFLFIVWTDVSCTPTPSRPFPEAACVCVSQYRERTKNNNLKKIR